MSDIIVNKLILLFVFDKMDIPLSEDTLRDLTIDNSWISYLDFTLSFSSLKEGNFIINVSKNKNPLYTLTRDGKECLSNFYNKINLSLREEIQNTIKEKRFSYKKNQEYSANYSKNPDGSYTVTLKINAPAQPVLDLKLTIQERHIAQWIYKNWTNKAAPVYELIYDCLIDQSI